jgi:hypothetical protein
MNVRTRTVTRRAPAFCDGLSEQVSFITGSSYFLPFRSRGDAVYLVCLQARAAGDLDLLCRRAAEASTFFLPTYCEEESSTLELDGSTNPRLPMRRVRRL